MVVAVEMKWKVHSLLPLKNNVLFCGSETPCAHRWRCTDCRSFSLFMSRHATLEATDILRVFWTRS